MSIPKRGEKDDNKCSSGQTKIIDYDETEDLKEKDTLNKNQDQKTNKNQDKDQKIKNLKVEQKINFKEDSKRKNLNLKDSLEPVFYSESEQDKEKSLTNSLMTEKTEILNKNVQKTEFVPGKFIGSKKGNQYHVPKCDWAKKITKNNRLWFKNKEEAWEKGYRAHSCVK